MMMMTLSQDRLVFRFLRSQVGAYKSGAAEVMRMKLVGANRAATVTGLDRLPGMSNYFIGNDPTKWRKDVPTYARVKYKGVYRGIDLVYYGNQRQLEYDFVVAPGADPKAIALAVETGPAAPGGAQPAAVPRIDSDGDLVVETEGGEVRFHKPVVYQPNGLGNGSNDLQFIVHNSELLEGRYVLLADNRIGFEVPGFDRSKPLIIDPVLIYSTYLGGSGYDYGRSIALDSLGNAYVTGATSSPDFPAANPVQATNNGGDGDVFVTKLNAAGNALVYSTYLGGSGFDVGHGIAVDSSGNAYLTGDTGSVDFPTANPIHAQGGAFVTKLNAAGNALVYSSHLGGSGDELGSGIAVDSLGNAYVTGSTSSLDFPLANALQITCTPCLTGGTVAFVTKLNSAGNAFVYSTYLGGSVLEQGRSIAADRSGGAYVTGSTLSTDFPTANPLQDASGGDSDAFVTKLNTAGNALVYSTYLGGSDAETGIGVAVDSSGNAAVTGFTGSIDFPTVHPVQAAGGAGNGFVTKLNAEGSAILYSTYLGGSLEDQPFGIAVDFSGNAYIAGFTFSADFPTASSIQATCAEGIYGCRDAFVTKLNAEGNALVYSTYLGGTSIEQPYGVGVDSLGSAYVTGYTLSTDFPTADPVQAAHAGGDLDAFVAKISGPVPFAAFKATVEIKNSDTAFKVRGSFTLGAPSNGINPPTEAVTLQVGTFFITLPSGSFVVKGDYVDFQGTVSGVALQAQIVSLGRNRFQFKAGGTGANLTGAIHPVAVALLIGDDGGVTAAMNPVP